VALVAMVAQVALFFKKSGLPDWAVLGLISMTPAIELRGGVPVGSWLGISPALTFAICVAGNMLPIAPMILALRTDFFKACSRRRNHPSPFLSTNPSPSPVS
jgi:hypothetical protein